MSAVLRRATDDDRDVILQWRNHPQVRRSSLTTHLIGQAEHEAWWDAVRDDPDRLVLIYTRHGRSAGVVTFTGIDRAAGSATWGFYLDVDGLHERNDLLPAWIELEREVIGYAFDTLGLERIGGETFADNAQVLQLHRRFGFEETDRYQREIDGVARDVVYTELRAAARSGR